MTRFSDYNPVSMIELGKDERNRMTGDRAVCQAMQGEAKMEQIYLHYCLDTSNSFLSYTYHYSTTQYGVRMDVDLERL
jgi:hypothetical protein